MIPTYLLYPTSPLVDCVRLTQGKDAIAAAISLRSYLLVSPAPWPSREIILHLPDIGIRRSWGVDQLPWFLFSHSSRKKTCRDTVTDLDPDLVEAIQALIKPSSQSHSEKSHSETVRKMTYLTALAFLYILLSLSSPNSPGRTYTLRSNIPIGAGLGSSASVNVCLAAAVLYQSGCISLPSSRQSEKEAQDCLDTINRWAFVGELCIHGNPSGIDNTVSTLGNALLYRRATINMPTLLERLHHYPAHPIILVDTRQQRSTSTQLEKVALLKKSHPGVVAALLDAISAITTDARQLLSGPPISVSTTTHRERYLEFVHKLGTLIRVNHALLLALDVSHSSLERIRDIVDHAGIGYTKLTGSGGGGCAIIVPKPEAMHTEIEQDIEAVEALNTVKEKLSQNGFGWFETTLAGPGVGIRTLRRDGCWTETRMETCSSEKSDEKFESMCKAEIALKNDRRDGWWFWNC